MIEIYYRYICTLCVYTQVATQSSLWSDCVATFSHRRRVKDSDARTFVATMKNKTMKKTTKKEKKPIRKNQQSNFSVSMFNVLHSLSPPLEILIWTFFAFLVFYRALLNSKEINMLGGDEMYSFSKAIQENYFIFFISVFIALIPILAKLIFGAFPFELLNKRLKKQSRLIEIKSDSAVNIERLEIVNEKELPPQMIENLKRENKNVLISQIDEATQIAEKIYSRSGVYLFVGCLIAFVGVFIFYSPFFKIETSPSTEPLDRFIDFLPRIAALFFVEYVAFFFLKQYRIMMEEYRYYEAIKRKKQNNYLIVSLVEKYQNQQDVLKQILEKCSFNELGNKLIKDESTEILETQKITNQEFNFIEKMMDLVKEIRK